MKKRVVYQSQYITLDEVREIRSYFDEINDSLFASRGPQPSEKNRLGWQGCWDRQLHYEKSDNPVHAVVDKLKKDFGNLQIAESSIRYLSSPFLPHSDVKTLDWIENFKKKGRKEGFIFLIPLWWKEDYSPGTAFFNSPPDLSEPLYSEKLDLLPQFSEKYQEDMRNFSIREIIEWKSPGDLIAWENFQFHSSCHFGSATYNKNSWVKEFISIETYRI